MSITYSVFVDTPEQISAHEFHTDSLESMSFLIDVLRKTNKTFSNVLRTERTTKMECLDPVSLA